MFRLGVPMPFAACPKGVAHRFPKQTVLRPELSVGFYRSPRACQLAGYYGERRGAWDDLDCTFVRVGPRRGAWALELVDYDNWNSYGFGRPFQVVRGFPA